MRQNFEEACEAAINRQINMELYASYVYLSMVRVKGHLSGSSALGERVNGAKVPLGLFSTLSGSSVND